MTYLRGRHLPRRNILRGIAGVSVALPFLEAMLPAGKARAAEALTPKRLGFIYFPNGYIKKNWTPATEGADYQMTPSLEPITPYRDKALVLSGLACDPSHTISGFHDRAICSFMTGVEMSKTEVRVGTSVDQIAAPVLGKETQFSSLELSTPDDSNFGGPCFANATNRLPYERNPRYLFERLFGDADRVDPQEMARLRAQQRSILDVVSDGAADLKGDLGPADKVKLDQYLDAIRDIERRLAITGKLASQKITMEKPAGAPTAYPDFVDLMFDLQLVALRADMTRVWTFMMGAEATNQVYPEIGWTFSHHLTSHHGGNPEKIAACAKINHYQVSLFSKFIQKMDAVEEADGTLLDNAMVMYGSSLGDADRHIQVDLPILLAGGRGMGVKGGRHLKLADNTPITNLYLTMLDKAGVNVDKMGDSTGRLRGVSDV